MLYYMHMEYVMISYDLLRMKTTLNYGEIKDLWVWNWSWFK